MLPVGSKGLKTEGLERVGVSYLLAGDHWRFEFLSQTFYLRDSKGLRYLLLLVENPGRKFRLDEVVAAGEASTDEAERPLPPEELFRKRLAEIRSEMQEADDWNDLGRRLRMQMEVERLSDALESRTAPILDGKRSETAERTRKSVGNSIRRSIDAIAKCSSVLAAHLDISVRTGGSLTYVPDPLSGIRWRRQRIFDRAELGLVAADRS